MQLFYLFIILFYFIYYLFVPFFLCLILSLSLSYYRILDGDEQELDMLSSPRNGKRKPLDSWLSRMTELKSSKSSDGLVRKSPKAAKDQNGKSGNNEDSG